MINLDYKMKIKNAKIKSFIKELYGYKPRVCNGKMVGNKSTIAVIDESHKNEVDK